MSRVAGRADLLIELGTEELPPAALRQLSEAFSKGIAEALTAAGVADDPLTTNFATPRRLAVRIAQVAKKGVDQTNERRGPALAAAYDDSGQPTAAAAGFARSCGVEVSELQTLRTDKGEWLVHGLSCRARLRKHSLARVSSKRWTNCPFRSACDGAAEQTNSCVRCIGLWCCTANK